MQKQQQHTRRRKPFGEFYYFTTRVPLCRRSGHFRAASLAQNFICTRNVHSLRRRNPFLPADSHNACPRVERVSIGRGFVPGNHISRIDPSSRERLSHQSGFIINFPESAAGRPAANLELSRRQFANRVPKVTSLQPLCRLETLKSATHTNSPRQHLASGLS